MYSHLSRGIFDQINTSKIDSEDLTCLLTSLEDKDFKCYLRSLEKSRITSLISFYIKRIESSLDKASKTLSKTREDIIGNPNYLQVRRSKNDIQMTNDILQESLGYYYIISKATEVLEELESLKQC